MNVYYIYEYIIRRYSYFFFVLSVDVCINISYLHPSANLLRYRDGSLSVPLAGFNIAYIATHFSLYYLHSLCVLISQPFPYHAATIPLCRRKPCGSATYATWRCTVWCGVIDNIFMATCTHKGDLVLFVRIS